MFRMKNIQLAGILLIIPSEVFLNLPNELQFFGRSYRDHYSLTEAYVA